MQLPNSLKVKFFLILFLSNCSVAMLFSEGEEVPQKKIRLDSLQRENYITLKIKAHLMTKFSSSSPMTITNEDHQIIIKNAFLKKELSQQSSEFIPLAEDKTSYLIEIEKNQFTKLQQMKEKYIYPYQVNFLKKKQGQTHEIIF